MTIHRVDVWSAAIVFAGFGLVAGTILGFHIASLRFPHSPTPYGGFTFLPLIVLSAIGGAIVGALTGAIQVFVYNVIARNGGGLRINLREGDQR